MCGVLRTRAHVDLSLAEYPCSVRTYVSGIYPSIGISTEIAQTQKICYMAKRVTFRETTRGSAWGAVCSWGRPDPADKEPVGLHCGKILCHADRPQGERLSRLYYCTITRRHADRPWRPAPQGPRVDIHHTAVNSDLLYFPYFTRRVHAASANVLATPTSQRCGKTPRGNTVHRNTGQPCRANGRYVQRAQV